jgi:uncharacterized membrane protein (DUF485 family)
MANKEEVLAHLHEIKSALIDKDTFFPYNYNALIIWGVIGMVMTLGFPYMIGVSMKQGTIFAVVVMLTGFIIESFLTKRVNENFDLESCTKKQRFIATLYAVSVTFAIVLSALFAKYHIMVPIFMIWIFMCGLADFVVGFVLNIKLFTKAGYIHITTALVLLVVSLFVEDITSMQTPFFYLAQGVTFVLLGVVPMLMGRKLRESTHV